VSDQQNAPGVCARQDAIDINDFVYAATGARVRRLTMPDGVHWFPAVDVASQLGYRNTRDAIAQHVPAENTKRLSNVVPTVAGGDGSRKLAGHGLKKSMVMVDIRGLIRLVNGCTKPEASAFKNWVTDVIVTIQRDGSYSLIKAEVQHSSPGAPIAYAMPQQVADAIVRLEERNLQADEEFALAQQRANVVRGETLNVLKDIAATQRETRSTLKDVAEALRDVADVQQRSTMAMHELLVETVRNSLPKPADRMPRQRSRATATAAEKVEKVETQSAETAEPTPAEQLLAAWRARVTITEDVWAVAVLLAPRLTEDGEVRVRVESVAEQTGLTAARVHDSLRFLLKRQCIRQIGTRYNAPVYAVHHA
jgi:prophage antirepressor-like protein